MKDSKITHVYSNYTVHIYCIINNKDDAMYQLILHTSLEWCEHAILQRCATGNLLVNIGFTMYLNATCILNQFLIVSSTSSCHYHANPDYCDLLAVSCNSVFSITIY